MTEPLKVATAEAEPRNGRGLASLIVGVVGTGCGLLPILFWIAGPAGLVAIMLAFANRGRLKRRTATNRKSTIAGGVFGLLALVLAIVGIVIIVRGLNDIGRQLDQIPSDFPSDFPT